MRKFNILLLIVLIGLFGGDARDVSAMRVEDEERWWTVAELMEMEKEAESERLLACGGEDNFECLREAYFGQVESGDKKYHAIDIMSGLLFAVTAVNPEKGTVKVLFHDEDRMLKWMGIEERHDLTEVYVVWREEGAVGSYVEDGRKGISTNVHGWNYVYGASTEQNGAGWMPVGVEVEIEAPDAKLMENRKALIEYSALAGPLGASGGYDYSACFMDGYTDGMECKMMISENMKIEYRAFKVEGEIKDEIESGDGAESEDNGEGEAEGEDEVERTFGSEESSAEEEKINDEMAGDGGSDVVVTRELKNATMVAENVDIYNSRVDEIDNYISGGVKVDKGVEIPAAGDVVCGQQRAEFPWWIVFVLVVGDILIMWWFWPENESKKHKNY